MSYAGDDDYKDSVATATITITKGTERAKPGRQEAGRAAENQAEKRKRRGNSGAELETGAEDSGG
ncbi:MAG: hypothetical protein V8R41_00300 [Dorea formicigenerans]